jgi:hypothetical protein
LKLRMMSSLPMGGSDNLTGFLSSSACKEPRTYRLRLRLMAIFGLGMLSMSASCYFSTRGYSLSIYNTQT